MGSEAVIFTAGAGMGVDSGLPDFRGEHGFWKAYPPLQKLGLDFMASANGDLFSTDPHLAWAFYGHRYNMYANTKPHEGYAIQRAIANRRPHQVFTSNVDDAYVTAGFDEKRCVDCHGNIFYWQSTENWKGRIWEARPQDGCPVSVDLETFKALDPLPHGADGSLARPNILMFGDSVWNSARTGAQEHRMNNWLQMHCGSKITIIECGAGTAIPSVRMFGERIRRALGATLIRINPRESQHGDICIPMGAKAAMLGIDAGLRERGYYHAPSYSDYSPTSLTRPSD